MKQLFNSAFKSLGLELQRFGFKPVGRYDAFYRQVEGRRESIGLRMLAYSDARALEPGVGVRFDIMEDIFHRTSGRGPDACRACARTGPASDSPSRVLCIVLAGRR